jgi:hypothetical protein
MLRAGDTHLGLDRRRHSPLVAGQLAGCLDTRDPAAILVAETRKLCSG